MSGTHGLAGAADTIAVLARKRQSAEGSLKITGRDVPENEYGLTIQDGMAWQLDGADLGAAASAARRREASRSLSDTSAQVLAAVRERPDGIYARDLVKRFGNDVYQYLKRLTESGRIEKRARGLYTPVPEPSEPSEVQVIRHDERHVESDSGDASVRNEPWPDDSIGADVNR
ncbi:MAG TPA: hypothetical protein VMV07_20110 [Streptosporangiaceae bacterium]|nr:hypothetical protein [Streptosporangiaceae bacterium]